MAERKEIRNSTAEFLIFQIEGKEQGVEVFYKDKTVWCTQKAMGTLFDVNIPAISKHLKNIYEQGELTEERTVSKMEIVRMEGNRQVKRETVFYNLDAVISVGYRVNSIRATQFRQWATSVLREFAIRGYVLDKKRMENGSFLGEDYFEHLLAEIREIRLSERRFYQKLTDIYTPVRDKITVQTVQVVLSFPHAQATHQACCECTRLALLLSSSLMHSMIYLFLSIIFSSIDMSLFFMFALSPCTRYASSA